jgi:hypothetical protein
MGFSVAYVIKDEAEISARFFDAVSIRSLTQYLVRFAAKINVYFFSYGRFVYYFSTTAKTQSSGIANATSEDLLSTYLSFSSYDKITNSSTLINHSAFAASNETFFGRLFFIFTSCVEVEWRLKEGQSFGRVFPREDRCDNNQLDLHSPHFNSL